MPMHEECGTCRHAAIAKGNDGKMNFSFKVCKRFPPTPLIMPGPPPVGFQIQPIFPVVSASEHCGEWAERTGVVRLPGEDRPDDADTVKAD